VKPVKGEHRPQGDSKARIIVDDEHTHVHLRRIERPWSTWIARSLGRFDRFRTAKSAGLGGGWRTGRTGRERGTAKHR
jgi:hypothetical protein